MTETPMPADTPTMTDVLAQIRAAYGDLKRAEIDDLRAAQLSGISIIPNDMVDRPTMLVPVKTWDALVAKYGKAETP
jgi:hypothetical protein